MKKLIALCLCLVPAVYICAQLAVMGQFTILNPGTGAPIQLTNSSIRATSVTLYGSKTPQTDNTGNVWVSYGVSGDGLQAVKITPGSFVTLGLQWPGRAEYALSNIWLDVATANDGVTVIYDYVR